MINLIPQPSYVSIREGYLCVDENYSAEYINNPELKNEEYYLEITSCGVKITSSGKRGEHYASLSFEQLKISYNSKIPCMLIKDSPRFSYRAFMIDCARHIISVEELKRLIDICARFKLNVFHWHLTDDQGFRIELDAHRDITALGSVRKCDRFGKMCYSDEEYRGYYTKAQMREIVEYCRERYIDVVPEFDMPGHVSALLHAKPYLSCHENPVEVRTTNGIFKDVLCVSKPETFDLIFSVLDEIFDIFPFEYIHIGGDEAPKKNWKQCRRCTAKMKELGLNDMQELQAWFINTVAAFAAEHGKKCITWNESLKGENLSKSIIAERWMDRKNLSSLHANNGGGIINASFTPYYCDYPYGMHSLERVYNYEPSDIKKITADGKKNILGVDSPVWTEFISTDARLEYMCFPRWLAVAESAWSKNENKNYNCFTSTLSELLSKDVLNGSAYAKQSDWSMDKPHALADTRAFFKKTLK